MTFRSMRARVALVLGLPMLPACREAVPPEAPVASNTPAVAATARIQPVDPRAETSDPRASAPSATTCAKDEVLEHVCGLVEPHPGPRAAAPFQTCSTSALSLVQFDDFRFIESGRMGNKDPKLASFRFDPKRTKTYVYPGTVSEGDVRCCYERCAPLPVAATPRTTLPPGQHPHEMCVPAPDMGTNVPATGATQCPRGMRLTIETLNASAPLDPAPFSRVDGANCCYQVASDRLCPMNMYERNGTCHYPTRGRALRDHGALVVAETTAREGWFDDLTVNDLPERTRAYAAAVWTREAAAEHASVAAFARLSLELMMLGAPADLVDAAHVAARDEIKHATLAYGLASAFGKRHVGPGPLALSTTPREVTLATLASECFVDGCIGETVAALEAAEARSLAAEGPVRDALSVIAEDEARHAELAYRVLVWALREGGDAVRSALQHDLGNVRSELARDVVPVPDPAGFDERLGVLSRREAAAVRRRALEEVVLPCVAGWLAA